MIPCFQWLNLKWITLLLLSRTRKMQSMGQIWVWEQRWRENKHKSWDGVYQTKYQSTVGQKEIEDDRQGHRKIKVIKRYKFHTMWKRTGLSEKSGLSKHPCYPRISLENTGLLSFTHKKTQKGIFIHRTSENQFHKL